MNRRLGITPKHQRAAEGGPLHALVGRRKVKMQSDKWIYVDDRLPNHGDYVNFVARANGMHEHLDGERMGGQYIKHGEFGYFTVPGLSFLAYCWLPMPDAPNTGVSRER